MFADVVKRLQVSENTVEDIRKALRHCQRNRIQYHEEATASLRKKYDHTNRLIDRAYEDKLNGTITTEMWKRKSVEWENKFIDVQHEISAHQKANTNFYDTGLEIIKLANTSYDKYLEQGRTGQRKLLDMLLTNCTFYKGTLCPTYRNPFDILAKGAKLQLMRGGPPTQQTFAQFDFKVKMGYSITNGTRWKKIG